MGGGDFKKADVGDGYEDKVILRLMSSDKGCGDKDQIIIQANEDDEQLSVANLEDGHDVLISLKKENPERLDSAIWLRVFDMTRRDSHDVVSARTITLPLKNDKSNNSDWLRITPLLLAAKDKPTSSLLFFTRFTLKSGSRPHYDFLYYRLKDLMTIGVPVKPVGGGIFEPRDVCPRGNCAGFSQAQVIPGWFWRRNTPPGVETPLDVGLFYKSKPESPDLLWGTNKLGEPFGFSSKLPEIRADSVFKD